jgi:hypothetical protein
MTTQLQVVQEANLAALTALAHLTIHTNSARFKSAVINRMLAGLVPARGRMKEVSVLTVPVGQQEEWHSAVAAVLGKVQVKVARLPYCSTCNLHMVCMLA